MRTVVVVNMSRQELSGTIEIAVLIGVVVRRVFTLLKTHQIVNLLYINLASIKMLLRIHIV